MFKTRRLVIICCLFVSMAVGGAPVFAAAPAESVINSGAADLFWGTYLGGSSAENGAHIVVPTTARSISPATPCRPICRHGGKL
jgi:hypothetical protein